MQEAAQKSSEIKKKRGILSNNRTVELEKVAHHRNHAAGIQKERRKVKYSRSMMVGFLAVTLPVRQLSA